MKTSNEFDNRVRKLLLYSFVGAVFVKLATLLMNIWLSNILPPEQFGEYAIVENATQTVVTMAALGFWATVTRYVAAYGNIDKDRCGAVIGTLFFINICAALLSSLAMFVFSSKISLMLSGTSNLYVCVRIASLSIIASAGYSILQSVLLGLEEHKILNICDASFNVLICITSCAGAGLGGLNGALWGLAIARIINAAAHLAVSISASNQQGVRWHLLFDRKLLGILSGYALPTYLSSVVIVPVNLWLNSMLARNAGFYDMAVYSIAAQWVGLATYIVALFGRAKPVYTELFATGRICEMRRQIRQNIKKSATVGISIAALCAALSVPILKAYGEAYSDQKQVFLVMMAATAIVSAQSHLGNVWEVIGTMWMGAAMNFSWCVLQVGFFMLLKNYGALGYSISYFLAYLIHGAYNWIAYLFLMKRIENRTKPNLKGVDNGNGKLEDCQIPIL